MLKFVMECKDTDRIDSKFDSLINRPIFSIANGSNCAKEIKASMSHPLHRRITGKFSHTRMLKKRTHIEQILAFLDFYVPQYSDLAPDKDHVFDIKESWESVYEKYVRHCDTDNSPHVPYSRFCEIRKQERPNFVKHASQSHAGFDHLKCDICDKTIRYLNQQRRLRDHEMDDKTRRDLDKVVQDYEALLEAHRKRSNISRAAYRKRRTKAVYHHARGTSHSL